jgi:hypothetical protein
MHETMSTGRSGLIFVISALIGQGAYFVRTWMLTIKQCMGLILLLILREEFSLHLSQRRPPMPLALGKQL